VLIEKGNVMKRSTAGLICIAGLMAPGAAHATGSMDCSFSDSNGEFTFAALFDYQGNRPLFQISGNFVSSENRLPSALRRVELNDKVLIQQWYEGNEIRLQLFVETVDGAKPYSSEKITVKTSQLVDDELSYEGRYKLEITPPPASGGQSPEVMTREGDVHCSAG
jgi:hypothetical protein